MVLRDTIYSFSIITRSTVLKEKKKPTNQNQNPPNRKETKKTLIAAELSKLHSCPKTEAERVREQSCSGV